MSELSQQLPQESTRAAPGRIYKSRKLRPCDDCRRRKVCCRMDSGPPCQRCARMSQQCTFADGPGPKKRPRQAAVEISHEENTEDMVSPAQACVGDDSDALPTSFESLGDFLLQSGLESNETDEDWYAQLFQSRGQSHECPAAVSPGPSDRSLVAGGVWDPTVIESLEHIPSAFSFFVGPTGVTDAHLISREISKSSSATTSFVPGLKYKSMQQPELARQGAGADRETYKGAPLDPIVYGVTDRGLVDESEPRVNRQDLDDARARFWRVLDRRTARRLIQLYTRFVDPYYPIISRTQVSVDESTVDRVPLCLLAAICATAVLFIMHDDELLSLLLRPPSRSELYEIAWIAVSGELHAPCLSTLQACLLLQQRTPTNPFLSDTAFKWSLMSTAVSIAQTLGLHRDASDWPIPIWERRVRRRTWWALWTMEKWVALSRGMPTHIHEDDFDVLPLSEQDFSDDTLSETDSTVAHLSSLASLTHILADTVKGFYTVRATSRLGGDLRLSLDEARPLRERLSRWRQTLPTCLSPPESAASAPADSIARLDGNTALHLCYIVTHTTLSRALLRPLSCPLTRADFAFDDFRRDAGRAIIRGALLCVRELVEFVESVTSAQWNAFWHSWSRPNFAMAGFLMVHLLDTLDPEGTASLQTAGGHVAESTEVGPESSGVILRGELGVCDEYRELLTLIRRWRWSHRISVYGAGEKGLTNLGLLRVETLLRKTGPA